MNETRVEIVGLEELMRKLGPELVTGPLQTLLKKAAQVVQTEAKRRAPADTGDLRSRIVWEVDGKAPPLWAKVGFNAPEASPLWFKARAMEFGTGRAGDPAVSHKARHWPPAAALELWASRHGGGSGAAVARRIGLRGGLTARRFLRGGFEASTGRIQGLVKECIEEMKALWRR